MENDFPKLKLAAIQAAPVLLDRTATAEKACRLIEEAADHGAQVVGFPEGYIPGFPDWYYWHLARGPECLRFNKELFKSAVEVPGGTLDTIAAAARRCHTYVVMGITEREAGTLGTLYNTQVFISSTGEILGSHRKLMPTLTERLVHAAGDGRSLVTYSTPFGPIGGLICGENTNSLARFALLAQGERIHVASWPAFPAGKKNHESIDTRVKYHAFEGRVYVISACGIFDEACLDIMGVTAEQRRAINCMGGNSGIVGPDGSYIVGPVDDKPQIVYADADIEKIIEGKVQVDITGHYNRFDLFTLKVRGIESHALEHQMSGGALGRAGSDNDVGLTPVIANDE